MSSTNFFMFCNLNVCFIFGLFFNAHTQETNQLYNDSIKSVRFNTNKLDLSNPIIGLLDDSRLTLRFDYLGNEVQYFNYKITLCDRNWNQADIESLNYLDGFNDNPITQYELSISPSIPYISYSLTIPNEDLTITKSGNYILTIYDPDNEKVQLTQRFCIYEPIVKFDASVISSYKREGNQRVKLRVLLTNTKLKTFGNNFHLTVLQNFRWETAINNSEPSFIGDSEIKYDKIGLLSFPSINEFRTLDLRNLTIYTSQIAEFDRSKNKITLSNDKLRTYAPYSDYIDINGKFIIGMKDATDPELEAMYNEVTFKLKTALFTHGDIYLTGNLTHWTLNDNSKMTFNYEQRLYEKTLVLKQGYYNYNYTFLEKNGEFDDTFLEGNSNETENNYHLLFYYNEPGSNHDQLVGFKELNSRK